MKSLLKISFVLIVACSIASCQKDNDPNSGTPGNNGTSVSGTNAVTFNFKANVGGMSDFMNGKIMFQNAAGNKYGIINLRYLVSDIILQKDDGTDIKVVDYHYVDIHDPSTLKYTPVQKIPNGKYKSITMVFGLAKENNVSGSHPDLNILSWNWPQMIGGGYHYMQLEGHFITSKNDTTAYQTHFGPTINPNTKDTINNEIHIVMQKNFTVSNDVSIDLVMHVNQWYENPDGFDLNQYGKAIMNNYTAQKMLHDNGEIDLYSIGNISNQ